VATAIDHHNKRIGLGPQAVVREHAPAQHAMAKD